MSFAGISRPLELEITLLYLRGSYRFPLPSCPAYSTEDFSRDGGTSLSHNDSTSVYGFLNRILRTKVSIYSCFVLMKK